MACRNPERAEAARARSPRSRPGPAARGGPLDLADLASVRKAAAEVDGSVERLDVLMNNAGIMALPLGRTADGFEMQFATNHLGHFALTGLLLPALRRAAAPRVVTTSSNMHRMGRNRWDDPNYEHSPLPAWAAYGQSKLANLLFTLELGRRAADAGSDLVSAAAHPGYASTHLQAHQRAATGDRARARVVRRVMATGNGLVGPVRRGRRPAPAVRGDDARRGPGRLLRPRRPVRDAGRPERVGMTAAARDDAAAGPPVGAVRGADRRHLRLVARS